MIELASPLALVLLPLPLLVMWLVPAHRERLTAMRLPFFERFVEAAGITPAAGATVPQRSRIMLVAGVLIWGLIVLALARPEQISPPIRWDSAARDLIMAVDISGSMDEKDFPSDNGQPIQRLAGVKEVISDFFDTREGERLALIVFGTKAFVQAPLTEDLDTLQALLDGTEVGMAGPHTALGDAVGLSIRQFETSQVEQRLLILLSDGSDTGSRMSPINAAEIAAQRGVRIITIGVGDPQGEGENRVDLNTLKAIAQRTGGAFFTASDQNALAQVYARIDELAPRKTASQSYRQHRSLAHWPMGAAAILALLMLSFQIWRPRSLQRSLQTASQRTGQATEQHTEQRTEQRNEQRRRAAS
uniref:VWA domain-containing protein n=1 Tax=Halomonas sp. TaxID=1486246 RepID=UPI0026240181|nr:VWA domain-containing protein [Halomonas sp.]